MPIALNMSTTSIARLRQWLVLGNLLFALTLCALSWSSLLDARQGDEDAARLTAQNLATSMSSEVGTELRLIDNALATVSERYANTVDAQARLQLLKQMVVEQQTLLRHARSVRWADSQGVVRAATEDAASLGPVGLASYFDAARSRDQTVVSPPMKSGGLGVWSIYIARRLINADGGFDGIVFMEVTSDHFAQLFSGLELGTAGSIAMRTSDTHRLVARFSSAEPASTKGLGEAVVSDAMLRSVAKDPERGTYIARSAVDQIERVFSYRRISGYPLVVVAGLSTQEYLSAWRRQAGEMGAIVAFMIGLIACISFVLYRGQREERQRRRASDRVAREQQLMLENDLVGMLRLKDRVILWNNRALSLLLGYEPGELTGAHMRGLYVEDETFDFIGRSGYAALRAGERFRTQVQLKRKDGAAVWVDLSGMRVTDEESLWMVADIDALKRSEASAQELAFRDSLTGLPNRRLFEEKLADVLAAAQRSEGTAALCYLDLDGFKPVNDAHGHDAGDVVLREVAARLQRTLRGRDIVARLGGDEFAIVLGAEVDEDAALQVLQRCLAQIEHPIALPNDIVVSVSASMGLVLAHGVCASIDVLTRADEAMYAAKRSGKGQIMVRRVSGCSGGTAASPGSSSSAGQQAA